MQDAKRRDRVIHSYAQMIQSRDNPRFDENSCAA